VSTELTRPGRFWACEKDSPVRIFSESLRHYAGLEGLLRGAQYAKAAHSTRFDPSLASPNQCLA